MIVQNATKLGKIRLVILLLISFAFSTTNAQTRDTIYTTATCYSTKYDDWTSTNKDNGSISTKEISFYADINDSISFDWETSSEQYCDKLVVMLDNKIVLTQSGVNVSGHSSYAIVSEGTHTLTLNYSKDYFSSDGNDEVYIKNIILQRGDTITRTTSSSFGFYDTIYSDGTTNATVNLDNEIGDSLILSDFGFTGGATHSGMYYSINGSQITFTGNSTTLELNEAKSILYISMSGWSGNAQWRGAGASYELIHHITPIKKKIIINEGNSRYVICTISNAEQSEYTRTFNNTKWQALYIPFSLKYSDWSDDFEIAYVNGIRQFDKDDDGVIDETIMDVIKIKNGSTRPNTPYLIRAKSTGEKILKTEDATLCPTEEKTFSCSTMTTQYNFTGTYSTIPASTLLANNYYAMGGGSLIMTDGTSDLKPFRWYLSIEARDPMYNNEISLGAKSIIINVLDDEVNEATGISEINASSQAASTVYDLNGRKMNSKALKSGLYIKNGKKYIVK